MPSCDKRLYTLLALLLVLLLQAINASAAPLQLGSDIPFRFYEDTEGTLTLEQFQQLPTSDLNEPDHIRSFGYTRSSFWIRFQLPPSLFEGSERWLELGPNFLDHLTLYYRQPGLSEKWSKHEAGDTRITSRGDLDYRFPVFILPPPTVADPETTAAYEVIVRIESSSAVMLRATLWSPTEFSQHAASSSSFWSFYFGLALISSTIAFLLALLLKQRLFWAIFLFSLTFILVACVEGYIAWIFGGAGIYFQHYLTSILTLLAYTSLLWMCTETVNIKKNMPRIHRFIMLTVVINLLLQLSIPLDFYGLAIKIQGIILIPSALIFTAAVFVFWKKERPHISYVIVGLSPLVYMICALLALISLHGIIPFQKSIYTAWQYIVLVNMALVLWLSTSRILKESRLADERKLIERELQLERAANLNQRQFIGIVSHEFRTPLAIISATLQNLQLLPCDQQIALRHGKIQRATDRLVQLTDNCLADARLEGTELSLQAEPINLATLIMDTAIAVEQSEQHQLRLSLDGTPLLPKAAIAEIPVVADRAMLRIALSNLIDNALKYAPSGTITIDIRHSAGQVTVSIEDQGPGIPAEQKECVFERYRRLELSSQRQVNGTGLGLYVARQILRHHDGDIRLATHSPQGCRFELILPVREQIHGLDSYCNY